MATKTVVCPECGAAAAPGRYACAECGALLASVAVAARDWAAEDGEEVRAGNGGSRPDADPASATALAPSGEPDPPALDVVVAIAPPAPDDGSAIAGSAPPDGGSLAFDEDAPLGSASAIRGVSEPGVLQDMAEPPSADVAERVRPETADSAIQSPAAEPERAAVAWPPPGDHGAIARPAPMTPAGAYLPPSAVLPPLDGPTAGVAPAAASLAAGAGAASTAAAGAAAGALASRGAAALSGALEGIRLTSDGSRQAVAVGAGLAALGLLLPWINGLPGASPFAGYLDRWGLAGPGMWLVFLGIVALGVVAGSSGRPAAWPVGLPAIALAMFLGGLLWPYLVGGFGRSIGIWVVLIGAIGLAAGGVSDRRGRSAAAAASGSGSTFGGGGR